MYHSEHGQDRWLHHNVFRGKRHGVVVEAGAMDGILHSNSLFFERAMGWCSILVEANPYVVPSLVENRPAAKVFSCALGDLAGEAEFIAVTGTYFGWSAVINTLDASARRRLDLLHEQSKRPVRVSVRPLIEVLRESAVDSVDYLSLDVEGGELAVLQNYPFNEIPIQIIGVEDNDDTNVKLRRLLVENRYRLLARIGVDNIWARGR